MSKLPRIANEVLRHYAPDSVERVALQQAIDGMTKAKHQIKTREGGSQVQAQIMPGNHKQTLATYGLIESPKELIKQALEVKPAWEVMQFHSRAAIFLKAADLLSNTDWRYRIMGATCLGQGKNAWQAEIDAAAELADFLRFNCLFAERILNDPLVEAHGPGSWNRVDWRPLEGFVLALSPFNFTAIGGNLVAAPALLGNVVLWKPSQGAILSNWLVLQLLREAGLPDGVIQWAPMAAPGPLLEQTLADPRLAGIHFTGSTAAFQSIWQKVKPLR